MLPRVESPDSVAVTTSLRAVPCRWGVDHQDGRPVRDVDAFDHALAGPGGPGPSTRGSDCLGPFRVAGTPGHGDLMMTIPRIDDSAVRALYSGSGPVTSLYFDVRGTGEQDVHPRWRRVVETLGDEGAGAATVRALTERVLGTVPGPGVVAAFAVGGEVVCAIDLVGSEQPDLVVHASLPHVLPLMAWLQEHPAHVVALVDRVGADLTVYPRGTTEGVSVVVDGPDDVIERNAPGGWSQARYQRRAEDSWHHNAGQVATAVEESLRRHHARLLLVGGDVRALQYLRELLPTWVQHDVVLRSVRGGRGQDGSWARRTEQVRDEVRLAVDEELATLLGAVVEGEGPGGRGVTGRQQTLAALADGRVATLLVAADGAQRHSAWYGPGAHDVAADRRRLPSTVTPVQRGPLTDVATRAAVFTGAEVRVVFPERAGDLVEGIGALCRYGR